ncbi:MAG TPA: hypothetical protein VF530_00205 [Planctomycetota bacterium]
MATLADLRALERLRTEFGAEAARARLALLRRLARARLAGAEAVRRLHEVLCFARAYPDDAAVLRQVERLSTGFARRADLRRHAEELADSGIAGTALHYPYFAETAAWLARRFPRQLGVDWELVDDDTEQKLLDRLDPLVLYCETPGLDEIDLPMRAWVARLKHAAEGDGAFLARSFAAVGAEPFLRESYYDELGLPLVLAPGPGTPARTHARAGFLGRAPVFQRGPLRSQRPAMEEALRRVPRVRALSAADGARAIELAREAMVTRSRDLDVFAYGDPRDVRLLECEDGLAFLAIGFRPERRLPFEAVYGFLTLKNSVPIGYVLNSALCGSAEIAYNVFETYRGGEAGHVYGWVLACVRHLFGVDAFTIYPYQLGHENEEGLASGAWWFYQRLGFRPRDRGALALMRHELARQRRDPRQRSSRATLMRLARHNVYYFHGRERADVIGLLPLGRLSLRASAYLARRFGSDRARGERECAREAGRRLGVRSFRGWKRSELEAWTRLAPVVGLLDGLERWSAAEKRAAVQVLRAKGGRRESDFVRLFDAHAKLRRALVRAAGRG